MFVFHLMALCNFAWLEPADLNTLILDVLEEPMCHLIH